MLLNESSVIVFKLRCLGLVRRLRIICSFFFLIVEEVCVMFLWMLRSFFCIRGGVRYFRVFSKSMEWFGYLSGVERVFFFVLIIKRCFFFSRFDARFVFMAIVNRESRGRRRRLFVFLLRNVRVFIYFFY